MKHAGKLFHSEHYVHRPSESVDPPGRLLARGLPTNWLEVTLSRFACQLARLFFSLNIFQLTNLRTPFGKVLFWNSFRTGQFRTLWQELGSGGLPNSVLSGDRLSGISLLESKRLPITTP